MSATPRRCHQPPSSVSARLPLPLLVIAFLLVATGSSAQELVRSASLQQVENATPSSAASSEWRRLLAPPGSASSTAGDSDTAAVRTAKFLLGAAAGLGLHEGGHLLFDAVLGVRPEIRRVDFGGIPFFAITHEADQASQRQEFAIASAGFWMQHLSSEIILTRRPGVREERAPVRKGILAFNILASAAYGAAAFAKAGPPERDTRAMAAALGVDEAWVGALVLVPAGLDAWRYFHPASRWAKWLSRGVKVGMVLLVVSTD